MACWSTGICKEVISLASGKLSTFTFPHAATGAKDEKKKKIYKYIYADILYKKYNVYNMKIRVHIELFYVSNLYIFLHSFKINIFLKSLASILNCQLIE